MDVDHRTPSVAVRPPTSPPRLSHERGRTVVWLSGEHDLATAGALVDTLGHAISAGGADLVVDLAQVTFIDAATIGVLVRGCNTLASDGRRLTLRSPSRRAGHVLDLCGLTMLVEPVGDSEAK